MLAASLLDHLIGSCQERRRNRQPDRLGRLEVDAQYVLRWLLDGEIARLGALQDPPVSWRLSRFSFSRAAWSYAWMFAWLRDV